MLILIGIAIALTSCDDGDIQFTQIDFDDAELENCDPGTQTTIFYKIQQDQALILSLQNALFLEEVTPEGEPRLGSISEAGANQVTYRIFTDNLTSNYFCNDIPPSEPQIIQEIKANGGQIEVSTSSSTDSEGNVTAYLHSMRLLNFSLVDDNGDRITNEIIVLGVYRQSVD